MAVSRSRCFLDVTIGSEPAGRLVIELFNDKTPKTCENFRMLCTGDQAPLTYRLCPFHRVIDEFMVQTGDITKGDGTGGDSIYGGEFEDENLGWREIDAPGLVCMANRGKGTNSSQFFITLEPCTHLNGKHTIFGHLVSGQDVLERIAKVDVDKNDRPRDSVLIARCGELERKKKAPAVSSEAVSEANTRNRGRDDHNKPRGERRKRRDSDNTVDETLRGRPLTRSESRSESRSRSPARQKSLSRTPPRKHKRRRSPSPSRGREEEERDRRDDEARRRRRSLPNQYAPDKDQRRDRSRGRDSERDRNRNKYDRDGERDRDRPRDWDRPDRGDGYQGRRYQGDRYDGRRDRYREDNSGRLGGGFGDAEPSNDSGIKFKGRGSMKYREPDRR
ncbi:hypothetical protein MBLNU457_6453t1 [Dothideomycetes sp. NU457]